MYIKTQLFLYIGRVSIITVFVLDGEVINFGGVCSHDHLWSGIHSVHITSGSYQRDKSYFSFNFVPNLLSFYAYFAWNYHCWGNFLAIMSKLFLVIKDASGSEVSIGNCYILVGSSYAWPGRVGNWWLACNNLVVSARMIETNKTCLKSSTIDGS